VGPGSVSDFAVERDAIAANSSMKKTPEKAQAEISHSMKVVRRLVEI
jgi:hypothetical protein